MKLELVQNPDIAAALGERKRDGQVLIGFAAESSDVLANAADKIRSKRLDYIVANDIAAPGFGFGVDTNSVCLLGADGGSASFSGTKEEVAEGIWDTVLSGR